MSGYKILKAQIKKFAADETGATAIEYGLIAALIAIGMIGGLRTLGGGAGGSWTKTSADVTSALS